MAEESEMIGLESGANRAHPLEEEQVKIDRDPTKRDRVSNRLFRRVRGYMLAGALGVFGGDQLANPNIDAEALKISDNAITLTLADHPESMPYGTGDLESSFLQQTEQEAGAFNLTIPPGVNIRTSPNASGGSNLAPGSQERTDVINVTGNFAQVSGGYTWYVIVGGEFNGYYVADVGGVVASPTAVPDFRPPEAPAPTTSEFNDFGLAPTAPISATPEFLGTLSAEERAKVEAFLETLSPEMRVIYEHAQFYVEPQMHSTDGLYEARVSLEQLAAWGLENFSADPVAVQEGINWSFNTLINSVNTNGGYPIQRGQRVFLARSHEVGTDAHRNPEQPNSDNQNYISGVLGQVDSFSVTWQQMQSMRDEFLENAGIYSDHIPLIIPGQGTIGFAFYDSPSEKFVLVAAPTPRIDIPNWRKALGNTITLSHSILFSSLHNGAGVSSQITFNQTGLFDVFFPDSVNHANDNTVPPTLTITPLTL